MTRERKKRVVDASTYIFHLVMVGIVVFLVVQLVPRGVITTETREMLNILIQLLIQGVYARILPLQGTKRGP